jgi:hypothetical protein
MSNGGFILGQRVYWLGTRLVIDDVVQRVGLSTDHNNDPHHLSRSALLSGSSV